MLTYTTKKEVLEYHGISADLRSTTIRMKGKRLLGTALGETKLPNDDIRMLLRNGTGKSRQMKIHFIRFYQQTLSKPIPRESLFVGSLQQLQFSMLKIIAFRFLSFQIKNNQ